MKVILVRHAETEWNLSRIIQGHSDSPITPRGMRETSALLAALLESAYPIACIYSSPLGRARQMGLSLATGLHCPLIIEPSLKEQAFGRFEGLASAQLTRSHPDDVNALFMHDANYCPPEGETLAQATQRIMDFFCHLQIANQHRTVCVVSHGQVSQGVLAQLKEGVIDNFSRYAQPNASYSVLEWVDGKCTNLQWGMATHLMKLAR
ncbi:histidine phosphatase family protein [Kluyvera genomosp. 2]|uniref:histidine phosphatase family protein n=1 Tax=Kluyvera genomosp. 2 TaxID=2774054 RepID=UPI002FD7B143